MLRWRSRPAKLFVNHGAVGGLRRRRIIWAVAKPAFLNESDHVCHVLYNVQKRWPHVVESTVLTLSDEQGDRLCSAQIKDALVKNIIILQRLFGAKRSMSRKVAPELEIPETDYEKSQGNEKLKMCSDPFDTKDSPVILCW